MGATYVQSIIPTPDAELQPAFCVDWTLERPGSPCVEVLLAEILIWYLVPDASSVVADLNALRPAAAAERPSGERNLAIVDDDIVVDWCHDCR